MGHIYRMRTLAFALREKGHRVSFLTLKNPAANRLLQQAGLLCHVFTPAEYSKTLRRTLQKEAPDLIIQDMLRTSHQTMRDLRRLSSARIINLDDTGAGLELADAVINSMAFHWGQYDPRKARARLFEGPRYAILHPRIAVYRRRKKRIVANARRCLLVFGGADTHFITERVLSAIENAMDALDLRVNLGPGSRVSSRLRHAMRNSKHRVKLLQSAPDLYRQFFWADLVICGGGITLYELAALGVPSASVAAEPHERYNVDYWTRAGATRSLGWEQELKSAHVCRVVRQLLGNRSRRLAMSRKGRRLMDNKGLQRVLHIIQGILQ